MLLWMLRIESKKTHEFASIAPIWLKESDMPTIAQANTSTTQVLRAVATSGSVFDMLIFARMETIPAKNADPNAAAIHAIDCLPLHEDHVAGQKPAPYGLAAHAA